MTDLFDDDDDRVVVAATVRHNGGEVRVAYTLETYEVDQERITKALHAAADGVAASVPRVFGRWVRDTPKEQLEGT